jgi:iron complex outermembrane receptor protein
MRFKGIVSALFVLEIAFSTRPGKAQELELQGIEVRAKKAPGASEVSSERALERGAEDLGEAVREIPGIETIRRGAAGEDVLIRGYQRDNINVLIDDQSVFGACPNRMDPPAFHIDLLETESISVTKGPFDVRHPGSLGGLLEARSIRPPLGLDAELFSNYGSFESTMDAARVSFGSERFSIATGGSFRFSRPYEDGRGLKFTDIYPGDSPNRYRPSKRNATAYSIKSGWAKALFRPSLGHELEVSYARIMADDVLYPYLLMDADSDDTERVNARYVIEEPFDKVNLLTLQFFYSGVDHAMSDTRRMSSLGSIKPYGMRTLAKSSNVGGRIEGALSLFGETTLGLDGYRRSWDATTSMLMQRTRTFHDQASIPDVETANIGVFLEQHHELARNVSLRAGVRLDSSRTKAKKDRGSVYGLYFPDFQRARRDTYPSGHLRLDYVLSKDLSVFLGFGHGVRVPDPQERYFALRRMGTKEMPDQLGNPGLSPVKNNEWDVGVKALRGSALLETSVFYGELEDFIVPRDLLGEGGVARSYKNVSATMYGTETSLTLGLSRELRADAGVSFVRGKNDTDGTDLPEIPPLNGRLSLRYERSWGFGEVEGVFAASQNKTDRMLNEEATGGYAVANLLAGIHHGRLRVVFGVRNLFDRYYYEHLSYLRDPFRSGVRVPEPGRMFYGNMSYSF